MHQSDMVNRYVTGNNFTNRAGRRTTKQLSTKPLLMMEQFYYQYHLNLQDVK